MKNQVFKFGGASIASADAMRNVETILQNFSGEKLTLVVSAMGKTTNALEKVVTAYFDETVDGFTIAKEIKASHDQICDELLNQPQAAKDQINNFFVEIDWLLEDDVETDYGYVYDQIVSIGELSSSTILAAYLKEKGHDAQWVDARELIHTDDVYQQASIDWSWTHKSVEQKVAPLLEQGKMVVTQGFIGSTSDNNNTTLGREGSDFTGAILANCLDAKALTIWKDVPGVLNADPRWLNDTVKLDNMNYREAVEQTYYGAKVIHPKTIKPLQNKGIPLHVRSFVNVEETGTTIQNQAENQFEKPVFVLKKDQVMLHCFTKDFSFFDNHHINQVMKIFGQEHCDINLLQNAAVQCSFVFDNDKEMIDAIHQELENDYNVELEFDLELLTIRHYNQEAIEKMTAEKEILMEQRTPINYQALYKL